MLKKCQEEFTTEYKESSQDQPLHEDILEEVVEYCRNDVAVTETLVNSLTKPVV